MMRLSRRILLLAGAFAAWAPAALPAAAQELRIGMKASVDNPDPHQLYTPNRNVHLLVYEPLMVQDAQLRPQPGVAESLRVVDPTTWEVKLRPGVTFSDGTPLTAEDVVFSIRRAQQIEGPRTYRIYVRDIASMEVKDAQTVLLHTRAPAPTLPTNLTAFGMVSARAAEGATEADFNGGRAALGTGPYRWVRFTPGQDVVLERNDRYWGQKEPWARVTYRFVSNDSARVAALLAGDLDVIDTVPPGLYARIRESDRTKLLTAISSFTLYMSIDQFRDRSPFVVGADGQPLEPSPLRNRLVRRAMSMALNRNVIAERAMEGGATPTGQFMPPGFLGYDPDVPVPAFDPAGARKLLTEAGYPDGFGLTLACTNDRYAGDSRVCQVVAQMLTAIGIKTQVEALPAAVFFRRAGTATMPPEFSAQMSIFSSLSGTGAENMNSLVHSFDTARGLGSSNRGRYSNPELDKALAASDAAFDEEEREKLARKATEIVIADQGIVPIFHWNGSWGLRANLTMKPRGDQYTYATDIRPAK